MMKNIDKKTERWNNDFAIQLFGTKFFGVDFIHWNFCLGPVNVVVHILKSVGFFNLVELSIHSP